MSDTPPPTFTLDELLAYLREEPEAPKDYKTTREWARYFDVSLAKMQKILREAFEADVLLRDMVKRERYDGMELPTTVYMFQLGEEDDE